ncbi:16S rRNA (cytosine(1402)-N(4))-methyltransferase RsmH [Tropicimonas marinistellae]|uniref:16S rRNA (cytosine(1402)-N(4))-methyltransferase RsmH n=1 Tax=Tropicimonas marinistellae TaxID=1739787 RepID=UPI00082BADE2|nr:16S rRNA (cytosine(1402)-N(4))-methyltransferase RsmH [Tropicimonas marinistellae]
MAAAARAPDAQEPHVPVLIDPLIEAVSPVSGLWLDGTFGAGGYTRRLLEAGADKVIGVDRDPAALAMANQMLSEFGARLELVQGRFSELDQHAGAPLDGVVLDLGVSSMQIDQAARGFSFQKDGPLDMRMSGEGRSAADLVNQLSEAELADLLFHYGEERAARRIARSIVAIRPFETTLQLAEAVAACLPRPRPGQIHPATRSFQALRIAVNDEFGELIGGLAAAERALKPGGKLAVVTFHSLEDRVVKRYLQARSGGTGRANRYAPEAEETPAQFRLLSRRAIAPSESEIDANPRARSAKLRVAVRTEAPITPLDRTAMGLPGPKDWWKETP